MPLRFDPPFSPLQIVAVALLLLGATLALYGRWTWQVRRQRFMGLLLLRLLTVLGLTAILFNPVQDGAPQAVRGRPPLVLLLDTSRSMTTADVLQRGVSRTRWEVARNLTVDNPDFLKALARRYQLHVYGFDAQARAYSLESLAAIQRPDGKRSAIGEALRQAVAAIASSAPPLDRNPPPVYGGILLLSDGRDNGSTSPVEAARQARARGFPVYTLCLGREQPLRDLQVTAQRTQTFAAPGQTVELTAEVRSEGLPRSSVRVDLLREGRRVATKTLAIAPGMREARFTVTEPRAGFYRYTFVVMPASGESDLANNRAHAFLSVMDARARVLLLEGRPSWDARFLARTLREDPTLILDSIFQLTPRRPFALSGDPRQTTLRLPRTVEELSRYDVLIIGKGYEDFFDAQSTEALKQWIRDRGGHLVLLRGRADERTPALRDLEPVVFSDAQIEEARVRLTEAGRAHPGFAFTGPEDAQTVVRRLPALTAATQVTGEKALTVVLARAQGREDQQEMALIAYQRYGQGKVVAIAGQGLWQWAFLPPDQAQYNRVYSEFWTQTLRWLANDSDFLPGQDMALRTERSSYTTDEMVQFVGTLRGPKPARLPDIRITRPDGQIDRISPVLHQNEGADFSAVYRPPMSGEYVASIGPLPGIPKAVPASTAFTVHADQIEDIHRSAHPTLMRQIAVAGGGQVLTPQELPTIAEKLQAQQRVTSRAVAPRTVWDRWWVLVLLVGLLTTEWLWRRRVGLP
ncbi:MAG: VWA domain-containing protein [Chloroherpetonaceae bacterium]|nr:VWA domain-containing protein [Chthonomonadaceae bacterium]MDW8207298.1 VWA domain-containing protein [Chloroherpetonaceae bacterium]